MAEEGKYRLLEKGSSVVQQITRAVEKALAQPQPISAENMHQFLNYLICLADASSSAPEPLTKLISAYKRNNMNPGEEAPLAQIDHLLL